MKLVKSRKVLHCILIQVMIIVQTDDLKDAIKIFRVLHIFNCKNDIHWVNVHMHTCILTTNYRFLISFSYINKKHHFVFDFMRVCDICDFNVD